MTKKYKLTEEKKVIFGKTLYRIQALKSFRNVEEGDLGGFLEKEDNLEHSGNAWVYDDARVSGNARVYDDARVSGNAWVSGDARVSGNAWVSGDAWVSGNARVYDDARVSGNARVSGDAWVSGNARVYGDAEIKFRTDVLWMAPVGSENGTLTVARSRGGLLLVSRGCFKGSLQDFENAVAKTHGNNRYAKEYAAAIEFIKLRFGVEDE